MKPHPVFKWLKANLGKNCLAPLTSTDSRALLAAVAIIELYSYDRDPEILPAFSIVVRRMQPQTMELAYHAIAQVMDWSDRKAIWFAAGLPTLTTRRCENEPK